MEIIIKLSLENFKTKEIGTIEQKPLRVTSIYVYDNNNNRLSVENYSDIPSDVSTLSIDVVDFRACNVYTITVDIKNVDNTYTDVMMHILKYVIIKAMTVLKELQEYPLRN